MPKDRHALLGIADAVHAIEQYIAPFNSADDFHASRLNFDAAMMNLIVIGEMVDRISEAFKSAHPDVDWKQIKGLRNIIAHDYFGVDAEELWQIIKMQLPSLKKSMEKLLTLPEQG
jgi:uncharacterized protein with HEPN domain